MQRWLVILAVIVVTSAASVASADRGRWIFGHCARISDGSVRTWLPIPTRAHAIPHGERDVLCGTSRGTLVLGPRGEIRSQDALDPGKTYDLGVAPDARQLGVLEREVCWVDSAGRVGCVDQAPTSPAAKLVALLDAEGAVDHLLPGASCALMRDHRVLCLRRNAAIGLVTLWSNAAQASLWPQDVDGYAGCALLRDGTVSCVGDNSVGQRGQWGKLDRKTPTVIAGLDHVDEVAAWTDHACARKGGQLWCWGAAAQRESGDAALAASRPIRACELDEAATRAAKRSYDETQRVCHDGSRGSGDDPMCRAAWQASPPGPIYKNLGEACDPSPDHSGIRWAPPTRVDGITDAVALYVGDQTCALTAHDAVVCFGHQPPGLHEVIQFQPGPPAVAPVEASVVVPPRGFSVVVGDGGVIVTAKSGKHTLHLLDHGLGAGTPLADDVRDALAFPRRCQLHGDGSVVCDDTPGWTSQFPQLPDSVRLSTLAGQGCALGRTGVLQCGRPGGNSSASRAALHLSSEGAILAHDGYCALYTGGIVRCLESYDSPARVIWTDITELAPDPIFGGACALTRLRTVECTGYNGTFQRGDELAGTALVTKVAGLPPITQLAESSYHVCALAADGEVWCWGRATEGETGRAAYAAARVRPQCAQKQVPNCEQPDGYGPVRRVATPMKVPGVDHAIAVGAGDGRTCVLTRRDAKAAARLVCWGRGLTGLASVPTSVD